MSTTRWWTVLLAVLVVAGGAVACGEDDDAETVGDGGAVVDACEADDVVVETRDNVFEPQELEIPAGTTVCWSNEGRTQHNVVPDDGDRFGIDVLGPGEAYRFTFEDAGDHPYHCSFHGRPGVGHWGSVLVTE